MKTIIREIQTSDNPAIAKIIKQVGAEFGAIGDGFGPSDPEVDRMSEHYLHSQSSRYFVALVDNQLVGGGGIAKFPNQPHTCELKKLFILPEFRNLGLGLRLCKHCLDYACEQDYQYCYLDTLSSMKRAIKLYEELGFEHMKQPMKGTIHNACNVWMLKNI